MFTRYTFGLMRYYVLGDGGQKYGPVDEITLQQWVDENRITPSTMLQSEMSSATIAASALPSLRFANATVAPPMQSNYPRQPFAPTSHQTGYVAQGNVDNGTKDLILAFVMVVIAFASTFVGLLGLLFGGIGIRAGLRATEKGQPIGYVPVVLCVLVICFGLYLRFATHVPVDPTTR